MKKLSLNEMAAVNGGGCEKAIAVGALAGAASGAIAGAIAGPAVVITATAGFFGGMVAGWINCAFQ
ncbi:hypothetical protein [Thermoflexibacter ruber]|uniref:Uncharacterized protein n=1 Tax=Thermoflexibacter ruber TaxID=1003 RepID=A0A1I2JS57_9BACT|nr:hypothetical protein [Thermoflexibacter ruber]SFF56770.1 hypothetical protein SAMN04488541_10608 [Thermoflexibacter ruber]